MIDFWITFEILSREFCCWQRISEQVSRHCSANSRNLWKICWGEFSKHVLYLFLVGTSKKRHQGRLETIWILFNNGENQMKMCSMLECVLCLQKHYKCSRCSHKHSNIRFWNFQSPRGAWKDAGGGCGNLGWGKYFQVRN